MTFWRIVVVYACLVGTFAGKASAKDGIVPKSSMDAKAPKQGDLSLGDVLQKYREKIALTGFKGALDERVAAQNAVDVRLFPGAWTMAVSGEKATKEGGDTKLDVTAKKKIAFGIDKDAVSRRYQAEAKAELMTKQSETGEQELEIAKLFTQLRQEQEAAEVNAETLSLLEPLERKAKSAAQLGTLGGFFATRLKLTVDSVRSDLTHAKNTYALQAKTLSELTGVDIPADPTTRRLLGRDAQLKNVPELSDVTFLPAAASRARQEALAAQATQLAGSWEIEAGFGVTRNFESKTNGIIFEVDIPLGTASAAQSEVKLLASEQALLKVESDYAVARAKDQMKVFKTAVDRLADATTIEGVRVAGLETLLKKAQGAFNAGQGDLAEIIETSKELHEAKIKRTELRAELEEASLVLEFFARGELL